MQMKINFFKTSLLFILFFFTTFFRLNSQEGLGWYQLHKMVNKMEQLTVFDRVDIIFALQDELREKLPVDYQWKTNEVDGIRSLILTGFSFELSTVKIAKSCTVLFDAYQQGAVHPEVLDFFDLIFASHISGEKLALLSKISNDLQIFSDEQKTELIAEFLNTNFSKSNILQVVNFFKKAHAEKLDHNKIILTALVELKNNDKKDLNERLNLLLIKLKDEKEKEFKILTYVSIAGNFKKQKMPDTFLDNFAVEAVNSEWSKKVFIQILRTLNKAAKENLQYEKLKTSIANRLTSTQNLSENFVKTICEQEYQQMKKQVSLSRKKHQSHENLKYVAKNHLNIDVGEKKILDVINSYLGTPYRWGGTSFNGIDCSGLTQRVFWKCGFQIPRTSRQQYQRGSIVNFTDLSFGDLVFFSTNLFSRVNHVGIYIGNNEFCHASSSRGVIVSNLLKHYYKTRFVGARRYLN